MKVTEHLEKARKPLISFEILPLTRGGDIKLRDRILNFLLGKEQKMLVLVPSEIVESVSIKEVQR